LSAPIIEVKALLFAKVLAGSLLRRFINGKDFQRAKTRAHKGFAVVQMSGAKCGP